MAMDNFAFALARPMSTTSWAQASLAAKSFLLYSPSRFPRGSVCNLNALSMRAQYALKVYLHLCDAQ